MLYFSIQNASLRRPDSSHLGDAFCMEKYNISRSGYLPKCHHMLRRVRDDDFMVGSWSESVRIVFLLAEAIHGVSAEILNLQISWQAQAVFGEVGG